MFRLYHLLEICIATFVDINNSGVVHFKCSRKFPKNLLN